MTDSQNLNKCASCGNESTTQLGCYVEALGELVTVKHKLSLIIEAMIDYESSNGSYRTQIVGHIERIDQRIEKDLSMLRTILSK